MEQQQQKMVTVSAEVRSDTARFRVGVQARSIREALSMVGSRYPRSGVRVAFPTGPEGFFVRVPSVLAGMVVSERSRELGRKTREQRRDERIGTRRRTRRVHVTGKKGDAPMN